MSRINERRQRRLAALATASRHVPVSFAIAGTQKASTTTLFRMLTRHREIAGGPEKEMRYFTQEHLSWPHPDFSDYKRPATTPAQWLAGDATPEYLVWPHALALMKTYRPDMRLIATFRDPIERAFSQWSMRRRKQPEFPDLREMIATCELHHIPEEFPPNTSHHGLRSLTMFTRGLYGQQLKRGLSIFSRAQWFLLDVRDLHRDHQATLDRVVTFLGAAPYRKHPPLLHHNKTSSSHTGEPVTVEDVQRLVDAYAADLPLYGRLSGLDYSHWPTARVIAGDLPIEEFTDALNRKVGLGR